MTLHNHPPSGKSNCGKRGVFMLLSYIRTIILYLILILVVRLMGKRQLGEMEPAEFVVTMLVADLASIPMQNSGIPLLSGLVPILTILGIQLLLAVASLRSVGFRRLLCGKPVILIDEGRIQVNNLRRARITLDELSEHLREKDVLDLRNVQYAILETNGQISVFPYPQYRPASAQDAGIRVKEQALPLTIVSDGKIMKENLTLARRDRLWLEGTLKAKDCTLADTLLLTVDGTGKVCHISKEDG